MAVIADLNPTQNCEHITSRHYVDEIIRCKHFSFVFPSNTLLMLHCRFIPLLIALGGFGNVCTIIYLTSIYLKKRHSHTWCSSFPTFLTTIKRKICKTEVVPCSNETFTITTTGQDITTPSRGLVIGKGIHDPAEAHQKTESNRRAHILILIIYAITNILLILLITINSTIDCMANDPFPRATGMTFNLGPWNRNSTSIFPKVMNLRDFTTPSTLGDNKNSRNALRDGTYQVSMNRVIVELLQRSSGAFKIYLSYNWNQYMASGYVPCLYILTNTSFIMTFLYALNRFINTFYNSEYEYWCSNTKLRGTIALAIIFNLLLYFPMTFDYRLVSIIVLSPWARSRNAFLLAQQSRDSSTPYKYYSYVKRPLGPRWMLSWTFYEILREMLSKYIPLFIMIYFMIKLVIYLWQSHKRLMAIRNHDHFGGNVIPVVPLQILERNSEILAMPNNMNQNIHQGLGKVVNEMSYIIILAIFILQAVLWLVPLSLLQITLKIWRLRIKHTIILDYVYSFHQIAILAYVVLPFYVVAFIEIIVICVAKFKP